MKRAFQKLPKGFKPKGFSLICNQKHLKVATNKKMTIYRVSFGACVKNGSEARLSLKVCPKEPCW